MKKLIIYQENLEPIILKDDDNRSLEEYTQELTNLLNSGNISMLTTSNSSVLIRPSKIVSTHVEEVDKSNDGSNLKEKQEDVITDMEE